MQVRLLYEDKDHSTTPGYSFPNDLMKDFNLDAVVRTMGRQDEQMRKIIWGELMHPLVTEESIRYRQDIVMDIADHRENFWQLHDFLRGIAKTVQDFREMERNSRGGGRVGTASYQIEKLHCLITFTKAYQEIEDLLTEGKYKSLGMVSLLERIMEEYPKERLQAIADSLHELQFWLEDGSFVISARFTEGLKMGDFRVNRMVNSGDQGKNSRKKLTWKEQISKTLLKTNVTMLQEETLIGQEKQLEEAAVGWMLTAFDCYLEDSLDFFADFYYESCFYMGCANLITRFRELGFPLCVPEVAKEGENVTQFKGLYDLSLAIYTERRPIPNDLEADADLFIISGANQGGKSTWLRSVGGAQIFLQCGMLVPAIQYKSRIYHDIFTHFSRKEDKIMNSGRFDEELRRMDQIMEKVTKDSVLFMNESFASTTEPEGAMILKNITDALYELKIPVFTVTHLFEYTKEMFRLTEEEKKETGRTRRIFLSAERLDDAHRTRRIYPAEPSPTSYGLDLYKELIEEDHPLDN